MKEKTKKMRVGVESTDFHEFLEMVNDLCEKHHATADYWSKEPPFRAVLEWSEVVLEAETVKDECELAGACYTCGDCPYLDYSEYWKSKKMYPCKYSKYGKTFVTASACELFYKELLQGEIVPGGLNEDHRRD